MCSTRCRFWLCHDADGTLRVVIAEVTNTYRRPPFLPLPPRGLRPADARGYRARRSKIFHVSPFQPVEGGYTFRFDIRADRIGIWIDYTTGNGGLIATLIGPRRPLTNAGILRTCLRRPFGSRRVLALIHWQALKLWWKGAPFRSRPLPPADEVTR